jgi:hypothetical protein
MPLEEFIQTAPEKQRENLLVVYYSFRDADPTEAELEAAGIKGVAAIGIGLMRQKRTTEPDHPSIVKGRGAFETIAAAAPALEVTNTELVLISGDKRSPSAYTITDEQPDRLVLRSVDADDGEVDMLTVTMPDQYSLTIVDDADDDDPEQTLRFRRKGAPEPERPGQAEEADLRADPRAAKLIGRWTADHSGSVSFAADGVYVIHGQGGDIPGHFRVTGIDNNELMLRTNIDAIPLASDRIRVVFTDDTHLTWTNLGTNATSQYVKQ